jgi:hypothetical protein
MKIINKNESKLIEESIPGRFMFSNSGLNKYLLILFTSSETIISVKKLVLLMDIAVIAIVIIVIAHLLRFLVRFNSKKIATEA